MVKWFSKAAEQGSANAVKGRDIVAGLMTTSQMAETQKVAWGDES